MRRDVWRWLFAAVGTVALSGACGGDETSSSPGAGGAGASTVDGFGGGGGAACGAEEVLCGNACVAADDPAYGCGSAGCAPCSLAHATAACKSGACAVGSCDDGFADCDGEAVSGCETATATDEDNCGVCGQACAAANTGMECSDGACAITFCDATFADCDQAAENGCETNLSNDGAHCGACGEPCAAPSEGATPCCTLGQCAICACPAGFGDCNDAFGDGCETDTSTSLSHCGFCDNSCNLPSATPGCVAGACVVASCIGSQLDCDDVDANGCEIDGDTSPLHCGACGNACPAPPNATAACASAACSFTCLDGFADCDFEASNGCEAVLATDPSHCGTCSKACTLPNGAATCSAGECTTAVASCAPGYADCDGDGTSGCEVDLTTLSDCGACGSVCDLPNAAEACLAMQCTMAACDAGFDDCDGLAPNGCEVPLTTLGDCGSCGATCELANASESCATGTCSLVGCDPGFGDCDAQNGTGCETALTTTASCGACGVSCTNAHGTTSCTAGACEPTCDPGFVDCDGDAANGCELSGAQLSVSMATQPPSTWHFNGSAFWDGVTQSAVLTPTQAFVAGTLIYESPIVADAFTVTFDFQISSSFFSDGMMFMIQTNGNDAVGTTGGGLGAAGLDGHGVELDGWDNGDCGDATSNHVAVDSLASCSTGPTSLFVNDVLPFTLVGTGWHSCQIDVASGVVSVSLDGTSVVSSYAIAGFPLGVAHYFGFAAATGGATARQEVRNVVISFPAPVCLGP